MAAPRPLKPLISYALIRLATLSGVVVVAVTVTIYVANMGGYVDEIVRAEIAFGVGMMLRSDEHARGLSPAERVDLAQEIIAPLEERAGLNRPFVLRTAGWLTRALTLDWGESKLPGVTVGGRNTREVQAYIRDRLPRTLLLFGTSNILVFFVSVVVALCFGLLAAVGAWFGGWVDGVVQRMTEVNMVLPFLPVSLMIFTLYSKSFWVILGVTVLLSTFGIGLRNYRAIFLSVKHAPYIEAALAYGAGNRRIVGHYLLPRTVPVLIPQIVVLIPSYVFLESALSFLGMSDPNLPTWGKLVQAAFASDGLSGSYHLVLVPAIVLLGLGLSAALVGYGLDRVLNPRLIRLATPFGDHCPAPPHGAPRRLSFTPRCDLSTFYVGTEITSGQRPGWRAHETSAGSSQYPFPPRTDRRAVAQLRLMPDEPGHRAAAVQPDRP